MQNELILSAEHKAFISKVVMKGGARRYGTSVALAKALAFFAVPLINCRENNTDVKSYVKSRVVTILDRLNNALMLDIPQVLTLTEQFFTYRETLAFPDLPLFADNDALAVALDIKVAFNQPTLDNLRFLDPTQLNNDYVKFASIVRDNL